MLNEGQTVHKTMIDGQDVLGKCCKFAITILYKSKHIIDKDNLSIKR